MSVSVGLLNKSDVGLNSLHTDLRPPQLLISAHVGPLKLHRCIVYLKLLFSHICAGRLVYAQTINPTEHNKKQQYLFKIW